MSRKWTRPPPYLSDIQPVAARDRASISGPRNANWSESTSGNWVFINSGCPASAPLGQIGRIEQERVSGSSLTHEGLKMRRNTNHQKASAEKVVKDIRRATRRQFGAEEKIRIVLEGLRGEDSIAELVSP